MSLGDLRLWLRTLHAEGGSAVRDRALDRRSEARRRTAASTGAPPAWPAPPLLNVLGSAATVRGGGVPLQALARLAREGAERPVAWLTRVSPGELRLEWWHEGAVWARALPVAPWEHDPLTDDPGWLEAVRTAQGLVGAGAVHVENLAGLSLPALELLAGDTRLVASVHDFAAFCRRPHLWQASGGFCDYSRDEGRCRACLEASSSVAIIDQPRHRARAAEVLRRAALVIFPSRFLRDQMTALLGTLAPALCEIVAPGLEYPPGRPSNRRPDQVAFLGGGADHKGGARFARLAAILAARGVAITVYGGNGHHHLSALRGIDRVRVRGYYRAGTLASLLVRQEASVALLLSRVPESFSLSLSEAWAAGVPAVATAQGALVERLRDGGGALLGPDPTDHEVIVAVDAMREARDVEVPQPPTAEDAARAMLGHYRRLGLATVP